MTAMMDKATAYLSKLEADRMAAMELSKEKALEATLLKARSEGFREAMEIFKLNVTSNVASNDIHVETSRPRRRGRRNISQMIIKELSYSAKAMTTRQIAQAIDYLQERTEAVLKRLEDEGNIVQNRDGLWEIVVKTGAPPNILTAVAR